MISWLRKISLADMVTLGNGIFGFLAITYILDGHEDGLLVARLLLLLAIVMDGADGAIARALGSKHTFGHHLDSISDTFSFCIAPALLLYKIYYDPAYTSLTSLSNAAIVVASILVFATGILRLARFVRSTHELPYFAGSPTPATAFLLVILSFYEPPLYIVFCVALLISFLMISDYRYPKLRGDLGIITVVVLFVPIAFPFMEYAGMIDGGSTRYILLIPLITIFIYLLGGPFFVKKRNRAK